MTGTNFVTATVAAVPPARGCLSRFLAGAGAVVLAGLNGGASAPGTGAFAWGTNAKANGDNSLALGDGASATGQRSTAVGQSANSSGTSTTVVGNLAGFQSSGVGNSAFGTGAGSHVTGDFNTATGDAAGVSVLGRGNVATGADAGRNVTGDSNTTTGVAAGQVATSDAAGNLATDGGPDLQGAEPGPRRRGGGHRHGENPDLVAGEKFGIALNWGNFEGANAFALSAAGLLGTDVFTRGDRLAISGSLGVSTNEPGYGGHNADTQMGARLGVQMTWK